MLMHHMGSSVDFIVYYLYGCIFIERYRYDAVIWTYPLGKSVGANILQHSGKGCELEVIAAVLPPGHLKGASQMK